MSIQATTDLTDAALVAVAAELSGGFLFIFAGPVPLSPADPLDMSTQHTQLAMLSVGNDGTTGLTFAAPTAGVLSKNLSEDWSGTITFSGAEDGETTLSPSFFRFCPAGDDGQSGVTTPRLQGTVGGPTSGADLLRSTNDMTDNGTNVIGTSIFNVTISSLGV